MSKKQCLNSQANTANNNLNDQLSKLKYVYIFVIQSLQQSSYFRNIQMSLFGVLSQMEKTDQSFKPRDAQKIIINEIYLLQKLSLRAEAYNMYEGININQHKFISIYIKPFSGTENSFSKNIKEEFRNKIAPVTKWVGNQKIEKSVYFIEVQQKFGPSIKKMFSHIKQPLSNKGFIHLFYQMLKLVQKIFSGNYVHRQLSPDMIVFDLYPQKNDLYILNCFTLKKRNQQSPKLTTKYCSRGSHLGLNAHIKDDLQSICYILIDVYSGGMFLKNEDPSEYEAVKANLNPRQICKQIPQIFVDFYYYVTNLNYTDQVNFFNWKNLVLKHISKQIVSKPYQWLMKTKKKDDQQKQLIGCELDQEEVNVETKISKLNFKVNQKPIK